MLYRKIGKIKYIAIFKNGIVGLCLVRICRKSRKIEKSRWIIFSRTLENAIDILTHFVEELNGQENQHWRIKRDVDRGVT